MSHFYNTPISPTDHLWKPTYTRQPRQLVARNPSMESSVTHTISSGTLAISPYHRAP